MGQPLDEDAPVLADTAAAAVDVLNDATLAGVGYPGLESLSDAEAVLGSLARLAAGLQETVDHLTRYLDDELRDGRLPGAAATASAPTAAVAAAQVSLGRVREAAHHMSLLLTQAELAVLALDATDPQRRS